MTDARTTATEALWRFGVNVRAARTDAGLLTEVVAEQCGISVEELIQIENGEHDPCLKVMVRLGAALNVPIADLLDTMR